jgi:hypothetical protein
MAHRHDYARDTSWHGGENSGRSFVDPNDPKIPSPIAALKPGDIIATGSDVRLELHGGFQHYGVIALGEQFEINQTSGYVGRFELIPGLWYYDEGLDESGASWMKKLKGMKPKDASEPKWWASKL